MRCPDCGSNDDKVIDSREVATATIIRRRRRCKRCGTRWTTRERLSAHETPSETSLAEAVVYMASRAPGVALRDLITTIDHPFASEDLAYEMILRQIDHGEIPVSRTTDHPVRLLPKGAS